MTIILRQCAVAVAVMLSGAVYGQTAIDATVDNNYKRYHGDGIDNVLQYVPTVAVFGLKMCGVKTETSWKKKTDGVGGIVCGKRRRYICSEA